MSYLNNTYHETELSRSSSLKLDKLRKKSPVILSKGFRHFLFKEQETSISYTFFLKNISTTYSRLYNRHIDLNKATNKLNSLLEKYNPTTFSSSWIFSKSPTLYLFFTKNFRTENGDIDWDIITEKMDRRYQKRWLRYKRKKISFYEKQEEVDKVLLKYKDELYLFVTRASPKEKEICNRMIVALVRLAQKGNTCAQKEIVNWVTYVVNDWIDKYPQIYKWQGYPDEVTDKITGCALRYKYTGSFLGYLFKTLEYSARGKPPQCSINDKLFDGENERIDFLTQETDIYKYSTY